MIRTGEFQRAAAVVTRCLGLFGSYVEFPPSDRSSAYTATVPSHCALAGRGGGTTMTEWRASALL